jgi:hypothetical protein
MVHEHPSVEDALRRLGLSGALVVNRIATAKDTRVWRVRHDAVTSRGDYLASTSKTPRESKR